MAEENKTQEAQAGEKKSGAKTAFKFLLGLIFVGLGIFLALSFKMSLWIVIKGCVGPLLILIGAITLAIAKE